MPTLSLFLSCLLAVCAGASVALQQVLNANLRSQLGSPWWAGSVSYGVGLLAMLSLAWLAPGPRLSEALANQAAGGAASLGSSLGSSITTPLTTPLGSSAPVWLPWAGGLFGAIFIGIAILMVPRLGAATTLALIVVGQMLGSLAFDHFGLLGLPVQPASLIRCAGAACLLLGVVLIRA